MKPCLEYRFAIKVTGAEGEATLELEQALGPASQEEIGRSRYEPEAPGKGFGAEVGTKVGLSQPRSI